MEQTEGREKVLVLVKALPVVGERHGEVVCCAGITPRQEWRRQFPVSFRDLGAASFGRWNWVEYRWRQPSGDLRRESHRVQEGSIVLGKVMPKGQRSRFLAPLIRSGTNEAQAKGESLTLVRPQKPKFYFEKKSQKRMQEEAEAYRRANSQRSLFAESKRPLDPCPYEFRYEYRCEDGTNHNHQCIDWETSATYWRYSRELKSEKAALERMQATFGEWLPQKGMVFAMGTHHRFGSWLLVGVIRLDPTPQLALL